MKKLALFAALLGAGYGVWRWQHDDSVEPAGPNLPFNRFWIDHLPQGEKDTVHVFALWRPESFGVFADQNHWRVELERFRYEASGDEVHAIFPLSGDRENLTLKATRCQEADMDFCLDVTGSKHGVTRYYSRHGWERHDRTVDEFVSSLTVQR